MNEAVPLFQARPTTQGGTGVRMGGGGVLKNLSHDLENDDDLKIVRDEGSSSDSEKTEDLQLGPADSNDAVSTNATAVSAIKEETSFSPLSNQRNLDIKKASEALELVDADGLDTVPEKFSHHVVDVRTQDEGDMQVMRIHDSD